MVQSLPRYSIFFMAELEEEIIKQSEYKPYNRYIENIFFLWEHGGDKLKSFIDKSNKVHPTIKPIEDVGREGGKKVLPTSYSPVTSTNVGISP